jgi:hypothetical protein
MNVMDDLRKNVMGRWASKQAIIMAPPSPTLGHWVHVFSVIGLESDFAGKSLTKKSSPKRRIMDG